ncbi:MAG: ABC transporter ATP-binding protein [Chitinophagaceae bacterium]|nr:ABC transporter ATP-binding protein [Chitinophagaceae bacterium]
MITVNNLTKSFGGLKALDGISIWCKRGECVALIGPNGSGKTTLIKCILGMVVPGGGEIFFDEKNIAKDWKYRRKVGYMPQSGRFPDNMTMKQVFAMMRDLRKDDVVSFDEELMEQFGLYALMEKRMRTLSGGTRQKVSAALAFLFNPDVMILDEPTAGLDPLSSEILKEKIRKEKEQGKLILITSHILSDLDEVVTQVIYLQDGKLKFHKSVEELRNDTAETKLSKAIAAVMREE